MFFGIPQDIILYAHLLSLLVAACGIVYADKIGFSWFRGTTQVIQPKVLHTLHEVMGTALALLLATGLMLFWPLRNYLVTQPIFYIKIFFVAALIVNSFIIDNMMHTATHTPYASLSKKRQSALVLSGGISFVCWVGAAAAAYVLFGWLF